MLCFPKVTASLIWTLILATVCGTAPAMASGGPVAAFTSIGSIELTGLGARGPVPHGDFKTLVLPIKRAHNLILVEGTIDSMQGNFILDFGSPYLVLNATYFRNYRTDYSRIAASASGRAGYARRTDVARLDLNGLVYEGIDADVTELGSIENRRGVQILGLLGVNLFTDFEVELDLKQGILKLHRLDKRGSPLVPASTAIAAPGIQMPIQVYNNIILLEGTIAGKKLRFTLDTGAEVNLLDKSVNRKVLAKLKVNRTAFLNGSAGGRVEVLDGEMTEMEVGGVLLKNIRTLVTDLSALGEGYGVPIDGMLGHGFLSQGVVWINFHRKELRILLYNEQAE